MRSPKEIIINGKSLDVILEEHQHWLNKDINGWENMCANLRGSDLRNADLRDADLHHIDLGCSDLGGSDLRGANLCGVNLCGANLRGSDLRGAYLHHTNLYRAELRGSDLRGAELGSSDLRNADLRDAKGDLIEYRRGKILTETIKGYKKCENGVIVTLEIPRGAIIFSINGNKCRTNKAKVVAIDGADRTYSTHTYMSYYVGDEFTIYDFNCEYNAECSQGIHFFMTREEAEKYNN